MKNMLKIYLYADNDKASAASIAHLGTIYADPKVLLGQLIEDHGPGRIWMDADGAFFSGAGVLLEEAGEAEEDDDDNDPPEDIPYMEKAGLFFCLVEGCTANAATKGLKTKKGILAHIAKAHQGHLDEGGPDNGAKGLRRTTAQP